MRGRIVKRKKEGKEGKVLKVRYERKEGCKESGKKAKQDEGE